MHVYEPLIKKIMPWCLFFFAVFFYMNSLCPTISWRDAPEFVTVSQNLDISHPAGSPTYSLSSKLLTLIPLGNIALRVNFFSAIVSGICISLIFVLLCHIFQNGSSTKAMIGAIGGSLSLVSCQSFWDFSVIAEVYTFQNLLLVVLLILLIKSHTQLPKLHLSYQYGLAFLYGLSLGVHASMIIFSPAFVSYAVLTNKRILQPRNLAYIVFFSIFGFMVYIFLPFRSLSLLTFDWGDPETFHQFINQIFDRKGSRGENYLLMKFSILKFKLYANHLIDEFSIVLCLVGIVGLFWLLIKRLVIGILLFLTFLTNVLFFLNAGWTVSWGFIPSYVIFSIFIGSGIYYLNLMIPKMKHLQYAVNIAILVYTFYLINNNTSNKIQHDYSTKSYATQILSELPSDAILFSEYLWFPLLYLQNIEHRRPDLTFILQGEILFPEYFESISKERFPNINIVERNRDEDKSPYDYFWKFAKANAPEHALYWDPDAQLQDLIIDYMIPRGLLFSFDPNQRREISKDEIALFNSYLQNLTHDRLNLTESLEGKFLITNKLNYIANFWSKLNFEEQTLNVYHAAIKLWPQADKINSNFGAYLMSKGYMAKALTYLKTSHEHYPYNLQSYKNLANFMTRINNYKSSLYFSNRFLKLSKHKDADINALLGAVYAELGQHHKAMTFLSSSHNMIMRKDHDDTSLADHKKKLKWIKLYQEISFEGIMNKF